MSAGKRNQSIDILRASEADHESGEGSATWSTLATVWAELIADRSIEGSVDGTTADGQRVKFNFPNNAPANTVNNDDRITWNSRTLRVVGVELAATESMGMTITAEIIKPGEA